MPTDAEFARWSKLVHRAADPSSTPNERATAKAAADRMAAKDPGLRDRAAREAQQQQDQASWQGTSQQARETAQASADALLSWLRTTASEVAAKAAKEAPRVASAFVHHHADRLGRALEEAIMPSTTSSSLNRATNAELVDAIEVSTRTYDAEGDQPACVAVLFLVPSDVADVLTARFSGDEGTAKITKAMGELAIGALVDTVQGEDVGEWPFDDDGDDGDDD